MMVPSSGDVTNVAKPKVFEKELQVVNNCSFPKYFVEGLALSNDGRLLVSSG
jgi:hypothetical protein